MEEFILDLVSFVGHLDFNVVIRIFLLLFAIFWFFIVIWVWFDAADKSTRLSFRFFSVLLVLTFNILGLIIYFLIRPAQSAEERYWQELEKKYLEFETCGLVNCSECGFELEPDFANCPSCGKDIKIACESCGMNIDKKWSFCAYCGFERDVQNTEKKELFGSCALERKKVKSRKGLGLKDFFAKKKKVKEEQVALDEDVCVDTDVEDTVSVDDVVKENKFVKNKKLLLNYLCKVGQKQDECIKRVKFFLKHGDVEELETEDTEEVVEPKKGKETKKKKAKKKKGSKKKDKKKKK